MPSCPNRFLFLFVSYILLSPFSLRAQVQDILPLGTAPASASVAFSRQWTPFANPAAILSSSSTSLTLSYENRYFSPELSDAAVSVVVPTPYFHIATAYNFFGFDSYHEMLASVSFARRFGNVALGIEADYFNLHISPIDGYHHSLTAQIGIQAFVSRQFVLGVRIFNPVFSSVSVSAPPSSYRSLPVIFQLGSSYSVIPSLDLLSQFSYTLNSEFQWALGCEYRILDAIMTRIGVRGSDYVIPSLGAGFLYRNFAFNLMAEADLAIAFSLISNLTISF